MIIDRAYLVDLRNTLHTLSNLYHEFTSEEVAILKEFNEEITIEIKQWNGHIPEEILLAVRDLFIELAKKDFLNKYEKLKMCSVICILGKLNNHTNTGER